MVRLWYSEVEWHRQERGEPVILHIFFASKKERVRFMEEKLDLTTDLGWNPDSQSGIKKVLMKRHYRKIPGFWLVVFFRQGIKGQELFRQIKTSMDEERLGEGVFFPARELTRLELENGWVRKYRFDKENLDESCRIFLQEIRAHILQGHLNNAYRGLLLMLRVNPFFLKKYKRSAVLVDMAFHFEVNGNPGKAIRCLKLQLRIIPDSVEPYLNLSSFYIFNGMEEEAIQLLNKALRIDSTHFLLVSNMVVALCNMEMFESAIKVLKKALEKEPEHGVFWKMLGDVHYEMERNDSAIRYFKKAIKRLDSKDSDAFLADAHYGIAACYYENSDYAKALEHYHKVLRLDPTDTYILISLAQIYFYKMGKPSEAAKYTAKIIERMPENGYAHYHMGLICMDLEKLDRAQWHLYKARKLMPDYGPVREAIQMLKQNESRQNSR